MISSNYILNSRGVQSAPVQQDPEEVPENGHAHTLDEIQRRACRIHRRHGGIYGGYTLEEWLEAEHELEDEDRPAPGKNEHVH